MHTVWKGSIRFGLVNIPVRMFTATEEKSVKFRQLHAKCHTPIRYQRTCPNCEQEVDRDDIVKGYELEEGRFVVLTDEEVEAAKPEAEKSIDILDFVDLAEIIPFTSINRITCLPRIPVNERIPYCGRPCTTHTKSASPSLRSAPNSRWLQCASSTKPSSWNDFRSGRSEGC